ncbi:hypothetical protein EIN_058720 [Entamoeba invadens IP1]|uniref:hypothetical protein n=1 Tax=Entamoeba invadens IP1 TaxID=370355 RepID=UPI0002C3F67D|nr:hypothetical protein EIN_058720 [Entamoeba invadens IP1]ELP93417.1 hypothetical protein EIN_058720 [Entamoeba invadens IP1]|eukprot:XP_004260188.1 hypothetical protein EIN_058720 [Entamoeba invadens IP1]
MTKLLRFSKAKTLNPTKQDIPCLSKSTSSKEEDSVDKDLQKLQKYIDALSKPFVDKLQLAKLAKDGVDKIVRGQVWKLLIGYIPCERQKQFETQRSKRQDYISMATRLMATGLTVNEEKSEIQIMKDIKRMTREVPLLHNDRIQKLMLRLLLVYSIKHPASGYVQGFDSMASVFLVVYLTDYTGTSSSVSQIDSMTVDELSEIEADVYWSFSWMLQAIQNQYTFDQPGIQKQIDDLSTLTKRYNPKLFKHFSDQNLTFFQFSFRWFNCCLVREFSIDAIQVIWDSFISEPNGFGFLSLTLFVSLSLLDFFSSQLISLEYSDLISFLQNLPTSNLSLDDIHKLIIQAYTYSNLEKLCN